MAANNKKRTIKEVEVAEVLTDEQPFKCNQDGCSRSFDTEPKLRMHVVRSHAKKKKIYRKADDGTFCANPEEAQKYIKVKVNGVDIQFTMDSGADMSFINVMTHNKLQVPFVENITTLRTAGAEGNIVNFHGKVICDVEVNGTKEPVLFFVKSEKENIFGNDLFELFGLFDIPMKDYEMKENEVQEPEVIDPDYEYTIKKATGRRRTKYSNILSKDNRRNITLKIQKQQVTFRVDSGSFATVLTLKECQKHNLKYESIDYGKFIGFIKARLDLNGKSLTATILVSNVIRRNLFGNDLMKQFDLGKIPINTFADKR